jgi:hypothetical protein
MYAQRMSQARDRSRSPATPPTTSRPLPGQDPTDWTDEKTTIVRVRAIVESIADHRLVFDNIAETLESIYTQKARAQKLSTEIQQIKNECAAHQAATDEIIEKHRAAHQATTDDMGKRTKTMEAKNSSILRGLESLKSILVLHMGTAPRATVDEWEKQAKALEAKNAETMENLEALKARLGSAVV